MKGMSHDDATAALFRREPEVAVVLLNDILANGEQAELLLALRQIAESFGGIAKVAERANLDAVQLDRTLSPDSNPAISTFMAILKAINLRLTVEPASQPVVTDPS